MQLQDSKNTSRFTGPRRKATTSDFRAVLNILKLFQTKTFFLFLNESGKKRRHFDTKKFSKLDFWEKRLWFASFCSSPFRFVSFVCLFFRLVSSLESRNGTDLLLDFSSYRLYRSTGAQFSHKKYPWYECHGYSASIIDTAAMASSHPVYNAVQ